jgi:NitT/TauT family transport system substrate-binding protein
MILSLIVLLIVFLSACSPTATPTPVVLIPVNVCYSAPTATQSTAWYALEKGLFEKYGLKVNLLQVSGGSKAITALISGDVSICQMTSNSVINAVAAGQDAVVIAGLYNTFPTVVLAKAGIATQDDLRGKVLGTSKAGSAAETAARLALQKMGLVVGKDVTLLEIGEEPERIAALEAGQVDAIMSSPPYLHKLVEKGYNIVFDFGKIGIPYAHTGIVTTKKFISENRPVVTAFMEAILEATMLMKTDVDGTKAVLAKYTGLDVTENAADMTDAYDNVIKPYLQEVPYPSVEAMQTLLDAAIQSNPDAANVTAEQLIDASIVKELDENGFIARLKNK